MKLACTLSLSLMLVFVSLAESHHHHHHFHLHLRRHLKKLISKVDCKLCKETVRPFRKMIKQESSKVTFRCLFIRLHYFDFNFNSIKPFYSGPQLEIVGILDKACTAIPLKKQRKKCKKNIKKRGDQIATKAVGKIKLKEICKDFGLC